MFCRLIERIATWRTKRAQRRDLAAMDGRTLEDIGLSRGAVAAALLGGDLVLARQNRD